MTDRADGWHTLLAGSTVRLEVETPAGTSSGTGFIVAPGVVGTCAHVLTDAEDRLPTRVRGRIVALARDLALQPRPSAVFRDRVSGLDLALLDIVEEPDMPPLQPVLISPGLHVSDTLHAFGHPANSFRDGQYATFVYQGDSQRDGSSSIRLPRGFGTPITAGFSGSPVVNSRTGAVCGLVSTKSTEVDGSTHLISISDLIDRCPAADILSTSVRVHRDWLEVLTDDQLLAGGWHYPGAALREYLQATAAEAAEHPPGTPELSAMYVDPDRDVVSTWHIDDGSPEPGDRETADPVRADVLLLGEPGAGKSTALRMLAIRLATHWLEEGADDARAGIPIRIRASALADDHGGFAERIAAGVRTGAGRYLRVSPDPRLFAREPMAGVRWLLLVDGLDEVSDRGRRAGVIDQLRRNAGGIYQIVVASRSVPDYELGSLRWSAHVVTERMLPLRVFHLIRLARRWFADLPDPDTAVKRFMVDAASDDLIGTPMLATMLCRLRRQHPDGELPLSPQHLIRDFALLLHEQQYLTTRDGVIQHVSTAVGAFGDPARQAAAKLPERIEGLLPTIATAWLRNNETSIARALVDATRDLRVPPVPEDLWRELVHYCAVRNGQLIAAGDDIAFLHPTLALYHTSRHRLDTEPREVARLLRNAFGGVKVLPSRLNRPEISDADRFAIGILGEDRRLQRALLTSMTGNRPMRWLMSILRPGRRLVDAAGMATAAVVADLVRGGLQVDDEVRRTAVRLLDVWSTSDVLNDSGRIAVACGLASLGEDRGRDQLVTLANDYRVDHGRRVFAAMQCNAFGDSRGSDTLAAIVRDAAFPDAMRLAAAENLAAVGDERGPELLQYIDDNPSISRAWGYSARLTLDALQGGRIGAPAPQPDDSLIGFQHAGDVALRGLRPTGGPAYDRMLAVLAVEALISGRGPRRIFEGVADVGARPFLDALTSMTMDITLDLEHRLVAASALSDLGDPRGATHAEALDAYPVHGIFEEYEVQLLAMTGDAYGITRLAETAARPDREDHALSAVILARLGDARGRDALALAASTTSSPDNRLIAASVLHALGDERAAELMASVVMDDEADEHLRFEALMIIGQTGAPGGERHRELLRYLAQDAHVSSDRRVWLASALASQGDAAGCAVLNTLATDPGFPDRTSAAIALHRCGDPRGASYLAQIAFDSEGGLYLRGMAAAALSRTDHPRRLEAVVALLADDELQAGWADDRTMLRLAGALQRLQPSPEQIDTLVRELGADAEAVSIVRSTLRRHTAIPGDW